MNMDMDERNDLQQLLLILQGMRRKLMLARC
jgi:hypothetical protein